MSKRTESEQQRASAVNRARVQQGLSKKSACSIGRSKARAQTPEPVAAEIIGGERSLLPLHPKRRHGV